MLVLLKRTVVFILLLFITVEGKSTINFTEEEKELLKTNPKIIIGGGESFEPFIFKDDQGNSAGYDRDIANLIERRTGLKIEFDIAPWVEAQQKATNSEVDGLSSATITKERKKQFNYTSSYLWYTSIVIINRSNPSKIYKQSDVINKKVAVQKGNLLFENLAKSLGAVEIVYYDTIHEVLKAVASNEVDFTVLDESVYYLAEKIGINDFLKTSFIVGDKSYLYFVINKNKPLHYSIFNKGLQSITQLEKRSLKNKWFKTLNSSINFSNQELEYLTTKEKINFCIDPDQYPFQKIQNSKHIGMSADIMKYIEKKSGITFNLVPTSQWSESLEFIKTDQCDILPLAMRTKQSEEYLSFTKSYVKSPIVISTLIEEPFIEDIQLLKDKKIAITKAYAYIDMIKEKFPNIQIVEVKSINQGLSLVKEKKVYGYIGSLPAVSYQINKSYTHQLKVSSILEEKLLLSFAINKNDVILENIMDKIIHGMDENEINAIVNKWSSIKIEKHNDYSLIYKIISFFLLLTLFILFWTFKLKKDKEKINALYKELSSEKKKIENLNLELLKKELRLEDANRRLKVLSSTDKLTKIYNRRTLDEYLEREINRSRRSKETFGLILIDIDHFKAVNDTYGHQVGDLVLIDVAKIIKKGIRTIDLFGRWGGEEFLIIVPSTKEEGLQATAQRIRESIEKHTFERVGQKTISLGLTIYQEEDDSNSILKRADDALYKAKREGRNQVILL